MSKSKVFIGGAVFIRQYEILKEKCKFWKIKKVWQPATVQPFEEHGQVVPFWKPPISHCMEPGGHGGGRTFRAQNH